MMNSIQKFCKKRKITKQIEDAFTTYCRSVYATRFLINKDGDTIQQIVSKMTEEEVKKAWGEFVLDLKASISK
jgi:hypothetical protein